MVKNVTIIHKNILFRCANFFIAIKIYTHSLPPLYSLTYFLSIRPKKRVRGSFLFLGIGKYIVSLV